MSLTLLGLSPTRVAPTPPAPGSGGTDPAVGDYDTTPGAMDLVAGDVLFVVCMFATSITDDAGNSWSIVASQGDLQVWRCAGTVNLGASDEVHTFGSTTPQFLQFSRTSWPLVGATVHLDPVPIDLQQDTVAGPGDELFVNVPGIAAWTSAGEVLLAMAQTNSSFPGISDIPNFLGDVNMRDVNFSRTFPVIGGQVNNPPGYGTGTVSPSFTCSLNHGGWSTRQKNAATYSVDWILLAFRVVESLVCAGQPGDGGSGNGMIRALRCAGTGLLVTGAIIAEAISVDRYDDDFPEAVDDTDEVTAADANAVDLIRTSWGSLLLLDSVADDARLRVSTDQGRTWSVATTIAAGYQGVAAALDEPRGLLVAMVYKSSNTSWYVSIGTLNSGGTVWTFTTPVLVVGSARNGGHLQRRPDGIWEFIYVNSSDSARIIRCRKLSAAGVGTWS